MWRFVIYIECPCVLLYMALKYQHIQFNLFVVHSQFALDYRINIVIYENDMWKMRFNLWLIIESVWNDIKVAHNSILLILLSWQQGIDGSSICRHRFDFVVKLKYHNRIIQLTTANFAINSNCARSKWRTYFQSEFIAGIKFNFQRVIILWFFFGAIFPVDAYINTVTMSLPIWYAKMCDWKMHVCPILERHMHARFHNNTLGISIFVSLKLA